MIPHSTIFKNKTNDCSKFSAGCLSKQVQRPTIAITAFNQAVSRGKLVQQGKQPLSFAHRAKTAFFTLANPLHCLSMVNKGKARFIAAATCWQFSTPYPLFAALNRGKFGAVYKPTRKAFFMRNQSIQTIQVKTKHGIHDVATYSNGKLAIWKKGKHGIYSVYPARAVKDLREAKAIIQQIYFTDTVI